MPRWGNPHKDERNWVEYNEELVIRGTFFFDLDFVDLKRMNGERGDPHSSSRNRSCSS